jgi:hypothetical protein
MMRDKKFAATRVSRIECVLLVIWLIVQATLLYHYRIVTYGEAEQYIYQAKYVVDHGTVSTPHYWFYLSEILLIAASLKTTAGFIPVIIVHLLLNFLACVQLFRLTRKLFISDSIPFLVVLFFIINIPYQQYNTHLYTESIFFSLSVLFSSLLLQTKDFGIKNFSSLIILFIILCITRPTGFLFALPALVYIFWKYKNDLKWFQIATCAIVSIVFFFFIISLVFKSGGSIQPMAPFSHQMVICGIPTVKETNTDDSSSSIITYIIYHTSTFLKLAKLKTISFFGFTRPYYSKPHNILLIALYYPWYLLCALSIFRQRKQHGIFIFYFVSIIAMFWLATIFSCDDWHNRFALTITPFIFILGAMAFERKTI